MVGFAMPLFVFGIVCWSYYVFVVDVCVFFYSAISLLPVGILLALGFHVVLFFFLWTWAAAIFVNPGEVPSSWSIDSPSEVDSTRFPRSVLGGPLRYCTRCCKPKPDRTHHCSLCGVCVLKMDHHCPWINNCAGFGNYKYFIQFLCYTVVLCTYLMLAMIHRLTYGLSLFSGQGASSDSIQVLLVYIVAVAFCGAVLFLLAFHIRLIAKNCTTLEDMGGRRSPYDLGSWKANAVQVFGSRKLLWFLPLPSSVGDGLTFPVLMSDNDDESAPLAESRDDNEPRISV